MIGYCCLAMVLGINSLVMGNTLKYFVDNELRAFVHNVGEASPGVKFFSEDHWPFQVGIMQWPAGHSSRPHRHNPRSHTVTVTSEALIVWSGRTDVLLYDGKGNLSERIELTAGSVCLMFGGAHGIFIHQDSIITELKQGPYDGHEDKVWLDEIDG
jgi:cupin fold WbuC family metalloprotein